MAKKRETERKRDRKGETLNHLSIHQWARSAMFAPQQLTSPISFSFLKLPPPPCAVLLVIIEGSLEVKLPTIWTDEKQRWEESEKRREEKKKIKKRKSPKKEDPGARKGRKVAKHCVFFNNLRLHRFEKKAG